MSKRTTISLPEDHILTVTADAVTSGYIAQIDSAGDKSDYTEVAASSSITKGAFTEAKSYELVSVQGELSWTFTEVGLLDDDTMATASNATAASSESVKSYVDDEISDVESSTLTDVEVTSPALGEVLIYDATDEQFENATLTAGQNIAITEGDASITIAVTNIEDGATADQNANEVPYDNSSSGLVATDAQAAIDEVEGRVDTLEGDTHVAVTLNADDATQETLNLSGQEIQVNLATTSTDGAMSATDKDKIDGIEALADVTDETNVVSSLDGATLTAATVASADKALIQDADDSDALKTATAQSIADLKVTELSEDTSPVLGGDLGLGGFAIDFPTTANVSDVIDDDTFATASATVLATAESIKAYADSIAGGTPVGGLSNVDTTLGGGEAAGNALIFNATSGNWENAFLTSAGNVSFTVGDASIQIDVHDAITLNADDATQQTLNLSGQEIQVNQATISTDGAMSAEDKLKLDGIESSAKDDQSAAEVSYSNASSGLTATEVQSAIDEVEGRIDTLEGDSHVAITLNADDATQETLNLSGQEVQVNLATSSTDGAMSATDKDKLDNIEGSADVTDEDNVKSSLSGATITSATVATADKVLVQDLDDSDSLKTVTAQSIADLATAVTLNSDDATQETLNLSGQEIQVNLATTSTDGAMAATDKDKLDGIEALADVTDETNVKAAIDGATITSTTVATGDKVLVQDLDDSDSLKTVTAQSIADLASGMSNPMTTAEDIIVGGASGTPARLAVGSNDQVLTVSSGTVGWSTPSASGAWTKLASASAASDTTIDFTDLQLEDYAAVCVVFDNVTPAADANLLMRFSEDNGSTWISTTDHRHQVHYAFTGSQGYYTTSLSSVTLTAGDTIDYDGTNQKDRCSGQVLIIKSENADRLRVLFQSQFFNTTDAALAYNTGCAFCDSVDATVEGIRFFFSSGDVLAGDFTVYGIEE